MEQLLFSCNGLESIKVGAVIHNAHRLCLT